MKQDFARIIENWYAEHRRTLPWRETRDAYRIWVSEIILQQTRVVQGLDYYRRFLEAFPTVRDLAEASEDEVLRLWQGLGYYSRARNLHKAARQVMAAGGEFPREYEAVRRLAGIGDYTAAAITSFAYDAPRAVLDGNVFRVLARVLGIDAAIDTAAGRKLFQALAQEMLDERQPSLYNQAIMDFGALQCTPRGARCPACPLGGMCLARQEGRVDELPVKEHRTRVRVRHLAYVNVHDAQRLLLRRRGEGDIWQGLYEVPVVESTKGLGVREVMEVPWVRERLLLGARLTLCRRGLRHQLSHQTLLVDYYELECEPVPFADYGVVRRGDLDRYGMSRLMVGLLGEASLLKNEIEMGIT